MKLASKENRIMLTVQSLCTLPIYLLFAYYGYSRDKDLPSVPLLAVILFAIFAIAGEIWVADYNISRRKYGFISIISVSATSILVGLLLFLYLNIGKNNEERNHLSSFVHLRMSFYRNIFDLLIYISDA